MQHGIDPNGNDTYAFEGAGKSELDPNLPQEATAPTNRGEVMDAAVGSVPVGGIESGSGPEGAACLSWGALIGTGGGALATAADGVPFGGGGGVRECRVMRSIGGSRRVSGALVAVAAAALLLTACAGLGTTTGQAPRDRVRTWEPL